MLHICTPLYRYKNVPIVFDSLKNYDDVTWHLSFAKHRKSPDISDLDSVNKIKLYSVDCEDKNTCQKRNAIFENIMDGYFCLLDDDTLFLESMYDTYKKYSAINYEGMIIGRQYNKNQTIRLNASKPVYGRIDTGNVLCHHACLSACRWPERHYKGTNKDFLFWDSVYKFYNNVCDIIETPISVYNKIADERRFR